MNFGLSPQDWKTIGIVVCMLGVVISAGIGNIGRDEKMKWRPTTEANRVPAFFFTLFVVAAGALLLFGPKGP